MSRSLLLSGILTALLVPSGLAQTLNLPLGGALLFLAKQAGYTLEYAVTDLNLLRPVSLDLRTQDPLAAMRNLLEEVAPGRYAVRPVGTVLRLERAASQSSPSQEAPANPLPSQAPVPPKPAYRVLFLFPDGSYREPEDPWPLRAASVVQEASRNLFRSGGTRTLSLDLSPLEITCLEEARQAVCLYPLFFQGEGWVSLELPGGPLRLEYRVRTEPLILRRYSLDGTYAPLTLESIPSPLPFFPAPSRGTSRQAR